MSNNVVLFNSYTKVWSSSYSEELSAICHNLGCEYTSDGYGIFVYFSKDDEESIKEALCKRCIVLGEFSPYMRDVVERDGYGYIVETLNEIELGLGYIQTSASTQLKFALNSFRYKYD